MFSILIVLFMSYFAFEYLNQYRYQQHIESAMSGTAHLLDLGAKRQQGENQTRWLSLAASLMEIDISIEQKDSTSNKAAHGIQRHKGEDGAPEYFTLYKDISESNKFLSIKLESLTEQIMTTTAFLLLNELGRHPVDKRQQVFNDISRHFSFSVSRINKEALVLDSRQKERLAREEPIVEWDKQFGRSLAINVYAPWGNTEDVLAMGPIQLFDPYPPHIVLSFLFVALILMAVSVMIIIKHLSSRLLKLQEKVDAISPDHIIQDDKSDKPDIIAQLNLKIQDMAHRIEKLLSEKAYMIRAVSHDLRTPIAKLHFRLDSLAIKLGEGDSMIKGCNNDLKQLNLLIDELLTYEKFSVKQNIKFEKIDISELVKQQALSMSFIFPQLSIELKSELENKFTFEGSEVLIGRLFENLLGNAGRYAKSKIYIYLKVVDEYLQIIIDDDGKGLDENMIPKLFDPFFQADSSRTMDSEGYGLGLSIVKQVAMQHGGTVVAANNALGGASFTCQFPLEANQFIGKDNAQENLSRNDI